MGSHLEEYISKSSWNQVLLPVWEFLKEWFFPEHLGIELSDDLQLQLEVVPWPGIMWVLLLKSQSPLFCS
jgi:hypothetical protein